MLYMMIRHRVADFARWRPFYDAHATTRRTAGLEDVLLLQDAADPNQVVILFRARDMGQAQSFASSTELRENMQKAGVIGQPEIHFLNQSPPG